jgi:hypothetical protein
MGWRDIAVGLFVCGGRARDGGGQAPFAGSDPLWAEAEYECVIAFADGSRFEGFSRGLCLQRGIHTDTRGSRWRVVYSGDAWLSAVLRPVIREEVFRPSPPPYLPHARPFTCQSTGTRARGKEELQCGRDPVEGREWRVAMLACARCACAGRRASAF